MAETQVTKVRLETLEQRVLLGLRVLLAMPVTPATPETMVRQVMVVLLVQVTLVIRARLVTKLVVVVAAVAVLEGKETTGFSVLRTLMPFLALPLTTATQVMLDQPRRHLAVFLLAVLAVLPVTPRTPGLIEHQMLVLRVAQVPQVTLVVVVILVAETTAVQGTPAVLVQPVMQETLEQGRLPVARVTQELPETKERLATQETLALAAMLVLIQPSVIL